jgi:hypothetical protein
MIQNGYKENKEEPVALRTAKDRVPRLLSLAFKNGLNQVNILIIV